MVQATRHDGAVRARPWVVLGCGYTGARLVRRLARAGAPVWLTRRSDVDAAREASAAGADAVSGSHGFVGAAGGAGQVTGYGLDLDGAGAGTGASTDVLAGLVAWLPPGAVVVNSIPPGTVSPDADAAVTAALAAAGASRLVYLSSTGVYPAGDGGWMDEDTPCHGTGDTDGPASDHGRARLAAETAVLSAARAAGLPAVSLRIVGIYGPGRGVVERLRAGTYRVIGGGDTYINRVHVDDLCEAIVAAAVAPVLPRAIYNVADDGPDTSTAYADAAADALGMPRPPRVPVSEVPPRVAAMLTANRRIANGAIKRDLGWTPMYPTWRDSLPDLIRG